MSMKRYRVRLVRPVFQVAVVEVEANDENDAMLDALHQADTIPEEVWSGNFDQANYGYDAQYVEEAGESDEDDYIFTGIDEDRRYLLLKANTGTGEGEFLPQPWLTEISDLMIADLGMDWRGQVEELEAEGCASFYESLEDQLARKERKPGKVIPFRRPADSSKNPQ